MVKKIIGAVLFIFVIFLFCYFRLKPLYFQTVGYTYDQGRDFLKAAEMIIDKNPTFIGPTTGIQGLFHGAWYYYLLLIPFLLFGGAPIGFYYFNFFLHLASFLLLLHFSYKYFGFLTTLILSLLIATSPYFIFTSIFVGNNIFVMPTLLIFILINYFLLKETHKKVSRLTFLSGLFLGLIAEFELAFGIFLLPSYFLLLFLLKDFRQIFRNTKNSILFLIGLAIPFLPRLLFELKNNFSQTRIFFWNISHGSAQNANSYAEAMQDRINLFFGYYKSLFFNDTLLMIFTLLLIVFIIGILENKVKKYSSSLLFLIPLLSFLFFFSVLYKDSFFWGNYFEGMQYIFLFLIAVILSTQFRIRSLLFSSFKLLFTLMLFISSILIFVKDVKTRSSISISLKSQLEIVNYIQKNEKNRQDYCVKVYTPPVIPHTYNYLFLYNKLSKKIETPKNEWTDRKCWYIVETDQNNERKTEWLEKNIPRKARQTQKKQFNEVEILHYELD